MENGWHSESREFIAELSDGCGWPDGAPVVYFYGPRSSAWAPFSMFRRHWTEFLRFNEDPLLVCPGYPRWFGFGASGTAATGERPVSAAEAELAWKFGGMPFPLRFL